MTMTDPIADMLTRIRNAQRASHKTVEIPFSKIKKEILSILKEEGYISKFEEKGENKKNFIVYLKYDKYGDPVIHQITRISKPGIRKYVGNEEIKPVMGGMGIAILSTNKGVLTNKKARQMKVGGELICEIW